MRKGVGPEVLVGSVLSVHWEMVIGILGISRQAGHTCRGPTVSEGAVSFMLDDARVPVLFDAATAG